MNHFNTNTLIVDELNCVLENQGFPLPAFNLACADLRARDIRATVQKHHEPFNYGISVMFDGVGRGSKWHSPEFARALVIYHRKIYDDAYLRGEGFKTEPTVVSVLSRETLAGGDVSPALHAIMAMDRADVSRYSKSLETIIIDLAFRGFGLEAVVTHHFEPDLEERLADMFDGQRFDMPYYDVKSDIKF